MQHRSLGDECHMQKRTKRAGKEDVLMLDGDETIKRKTWRDDPITEKQKKFIEEMYEFSEYPIPVFTGTTKGEACEYIGRWMGEAHKTILDCYDTTQGIL